MYEANVDLSGLRRAMAGMESRRVEAAIETAAGLSELIVRTLESTLPRDTNRLVRASVQAYNDVARRLGGATRPEPSLKESKTRQAFLEALEEQIEYWERKVGQWTRWDEKYQREGRTGQGWYQTIAREKAIAERRLRRSLEELSKFTGQPFALLFVHGGFQAGRHTDRFDRHGRRRLVTVRDRVYGGRGRVDVGGSRVFVSMINDEPHARIIESRRGRLFRRALLLARNFGAESVGRNAIERIAREAGFIVRRRDLNALTPRRAA